MTTVLESIKSINLEEWLSLNTAASPTRLKQGETPAALNVWTDERPGSVITAPGFLKVGDLPSGNPMTFCIDYFNSNGTHTFVASDNQTVYTTTDFQNFTSIKSGLSSGFQLRGLIIRNKLWLTNGSDDVMTFDGSTVTELDGTGGTPDVPTGRYIAYHDERVWVFHTPSDRSGGFFSALINSSGTIIDPDNVNAWPSDNELQFSEADGDFGTGLILYRGYLYAFKQYSIYRIVGYDEYTYARVKTRASTGTRFSETVQIKDNLCHLVGVDGIYTFDGEDAERISDIIDPPGGSNAVFGFKQLQQPNVNSEFSQTATTADWNQGTVPTNVTVDDMVVLKASDDSQADFAAGVTQTQVATGDNPGAVQLGHTTAGVSEENVASGKTVTLTTFGATSIIGASGYATDGNLTNAVGFSGASATGTIAIAVNTSYYMTTIIFRSFTCGVGGLSFVADSVAINPTAVSGYAGASVGAGFINVGATSAPSVNLVVTFPFFTANTITITVGCGGGMTTTEIEVRSSIFYGSGQFVSKALDLGTTPSSSQMSLVADADSNGGSINYFTQTSTDGVSWDAAAYITSGLILSTLRRYIRWGADIFPSSGSVATPAINAVYLPSIYISKVINTGGSIVSWGPFESEYDENGQGINFYYRTATTEAGVSGATWRLIVPGGAISDSISNSFVQFKFEIVAGGPTTLPEVSSVTINWVTGAGVTQNMVSYVWRNRYWLAAAGEGATANDTLIVRGKKTFGAPWQLKDWPIASFTRYQDEFYGGSSVDGSIYRLDTGYSKDGETMDSYFETGDFIFGGFFIKMKEVLIEVERGGPYSLTVGVSIDQGTTWTDKLVDLSDSDFAPTYTKRINFNINSTDRLRFRVRIKGIDQPFQVHRFIAFYEYKQSRGSIDGE